MNLKRIPGLAAPALVFTFLATALNPPQRASADTLTWRIKSNYKYKIQIAFYSQTRAVTWPSGGVWNLNDYGTHTYTLSCIAGEKICFGAWETGNSDTYWGVGYNSEYGCSKCCYICGAGETRLQELDSGRAAGR